MSKAKWEPVFTIRGQVIAWDVLQSVVMVAELARRSVRLKMNGNAVVVEMRVPAPKAVKRIVEQGVSDE